MKWIDIEREKDGKRPERHLQINKIRVIHKFYLVCVMCIAVMGFVLFCLTVGRILRLYNKLERWTRESAYHHQNVFKLCNISYWIQTIKKGKSFHFLNSEMTGMWTEWILWNGFWKIQCWMMYKWGKYKPILDQFPDSFVSLPNLKHTCTPYKFVHAIVCLHFNFQSYKLKFAWEPTTPCSVAGRVFLLFDVCFEMQWNFMHIILTVAASNSRSESVSRIAFNFESNAQQGCAISQHKFK